jgi:hypothetical protein
MLIRTWLVRWPRHAGTIDFCPALAALVSPVQNIIFLTAHFFTLLVPIAQAVVHLHLYRVPFLCLCGYECSNERFSMQKKIQSYIHHQPTRTHLMVIGVGGAESCGCTVAEYAGPDLLPRLGEVAAALPLQTGRVTRVPAHKYHRLAL